MRGGPHFVRRENKAGQTTWYVYAYRGGPRLLTASGAKKPQLKRADLIRLGELLATTQDNGEMKTPDVIRKWQQSPEWLGLAPSTRRIWGGALDAIEAKWPEVPLKLWSDKRMVQKVVAWRDSLAETPRTADIKVMVLRRLLEWGRLHGLIEHNRAEGIPTLYKGANRADIVWTDDDIKAFLEVASPEMSVAIRLASLTGLRRADLVSLKWDHVGSEMIVKTAQKKSRGKRHSANIPIIPALAELLNELSSSIRPDGVDNVLVNSFGKPWSTDGFTGRFNSFRDKANAGRGIWHVEDGEAPRAKHLHDLRGTFATKLMTAPGVRLMDEEIASIMSWSPAQVAQIRKMYVGNRAISESVMRKISQAV